MTDKNKLFNESRGTFTPSPNAVGLPIPNQEAKKYYFGIMHPSGKIFINILEATEPWAWAVVYNNTIGVHDGKLPSQIPPDFIAGLKQLGFRAVKMTPESIND